MRRCVLALWLVAVVYLSGCAFGDMLTGVVRDEQGNVIGTTPNSPIDMVGGLLGQFGPWGVGAAALLRWGTVEYRHRRLIAAGKKDDDRDGNEDQPVLPPPPPSVT